MDCPDENDSTFLVLWEKSESRIRTFLRAMVFDQDDREDIYQEVACTALRLYDRYDEKKGTFTSWILGICKNVYKHYSRRNSRSRVVVDSDLAERVADIIASERFEQNEKLLKIALDSEIRKLNRDELRLLEMRYWSNMEFRNIAKKMETTECAVKMRIQRIKTKLKIAMGVP